jgi:Inosine-uridine preferring nucleoside hydrolase
VKKIIIDTDPGIDDAVAIMFALGSGQLDVKAITTESGNLTADRCSVNARKILELVNARNIPVARFDLIHATRSRMAITDWEISTCPNPACRKTTGLPRTCWSTS